MGHILPYWGGVKIGDNCVIGAGSLIKENVPDNMVVAGVPARCICSIEEYREKAKKRYLDSVKIIIEEYKSVHGCIPPEEELYEQYSLFLTKEELKVKYPRCISFYHLENVEVNPIFNGYEDMLRQLGYIEHRE